MSEVLLYRLRMNREAILEDLEPDQVMEYLYQEDVLDGDKYEEVHDKGSRKKQAELLLSYVERDSSAIQKMIDALERTSQRHLSCILNEALPDEVALSKGILKSFQNDQDCRTYQMTHVPCGYAVIINNYEFDENAKMELREGSQIDVKRMTKLFEWLQFKVDIYENQKAAQITSIVRKYSVDIDHKNFDCFVLFLMSHGDPHGIFGTDGKLVYLRHIRDNFTADKCFSLANKPKIIFVQACRGKNPAKGYVLTDSPDPQAGTTPAQEVNSCPTYTPSNTDNQTPDYTIPKVDVEYIPHDADIVIAYASTANYAALRNTATGGWFVTQLDNVMRECAETEDLQSMITKVTLQVSSKKLSIEKKSTQRFDHHDVYMQCPEQMGNLRKKVIFKPKKSS